MATIGLQNLHYATITKDDETGTTYSEIKKIAPAISVGMTTTTNSAILYADDAPGDIDTTTGATEVTINTADLPTAVEAALLGHTVNEAGVLVENFDDQPPYVAIGFSSRTSDGGEMFVWLLKGKFRVPDANHATKTDNIEYQTPSIVGTFVRRQFDNNWRYKARSTDEGMDAQTITNWFDETVLQNGSYTGL